MKRQKVMERQFSKEIKKSNDVIRSKSPSNSEGRIILVQSTKKGKLTLLYKDKRSNAKWEPVHKLNHFDYKPLDFENVIQASLYSLKLPNNIKKLEMEKLALYKN